ncbi:MAG: ATP-binding protein [Candidatus Electryonea clarkiae]|nr:ATP-binding protein [Candidatus Electryonea clarkiae]MDP8285260.1 ATP-binding protein [Candidatus Electryonea clarkiae]
MHSQPEYVGERRGETVEEILQRELFERMPFNLSIIDRDYNVIRANSNFEEYFGDWRDKKCYEVYRGRSEPCADCAAIKTFEDGKARITDESGFQRKGSISHYITHIAPLRNRDGTIQYVLEQSTDVTETSRFQREYDILFDRVPCYISIINKNFRIFRANEKFRNTFGDGRGNYCYQYYKRRNSPCNGCPAALTFKDGKEHQSEQVGITRDGKESHYVVTTAPLSRGDGEIEHVIEIATDVTAVKKLESEKIEAERLAAVGQTVAGLAHTIKNLLMGLEGGMYRLDSGLKRADVTRISDGWEILQRNFEKTTTLVKDFLAFSKGRTPLVKPTDPVVLAQDIIDLYRDTAAHQGVELTLETKEHPAIAPLDPDGIEACITNLVSNGIDAAILNEKTDGRVTIGVYEKDNELMFEVHDNGCGMDQEIKQQVFTTFFTTKGGQGTGLGLLTTRKIIQEHGGSLEMESELGEGSIFRVRLPIARLEAIEKSQNREEEQGESNG